MIREFESQLNILTAKCTFIQLILNDTINIRNTTKSELIALLINHNIPRELCDTFLQLPMISLTTEKVQELKRSYDMIVSSLHTIRQSTPESLWYKDLSVLEKQLCTTTTLKRKIHN